MRFGFQFRMPCAADCFQPRGNRNAIVEELSLQQTFVRRVEITPLDVETGQRQTLARSFVRVFVGSGHIAHALTQLN